MDGAVEKCVESQYQAWASSGSKPESIASYTYGTASYIADFHNMVQTRTNTRKVRKILRAPNPHYAQDGKGK